MEVPCVRLKTGRYRRDTDLWHHKYIVRRLIDPIETTLDEYQIVPDTGWNSIPASNMAKPVGRIAPGDVKEHSDATGSSFWVEREGQDIAFVATDIIGNFIAMREAFVIPAYQWIGVMSELAHFIIRQQGKKLINDTQMTKLGLIFWKGLIKSLTPSIVDIANGKKYDISDPNAPQPSSDSAQKDFYDQNTKSGQRYFYMVEAPQSFEHIVEGVTHTYHCDDARHRALGRSRAHLPSYFGLGDI